MTKIRPTHTPHTHTHPHTHPHKRHKNGNFECKLKFAVVTSIDQTVIKDFFILLNDLLYHKMHITAPIAKKIVLKDTVLTGLV